MDCDSSTKPSLLLLKFIYFLMDFLIYNIRTMLHVDYHYFFPGLNFPRNAYTIPDSITVSVNVIPLKRASPRRDGCGSFTGLSKPLCISGRGFDLQKHGLPIMRISGRLCCRTHELYLN